MALRIVANRPDPALLRLPWPRRWRSGATSYVVPLPRGLSRHVVRIVRLGERTYAVKETVEDIAFREYRLLRDLQRLGLPASCRRAWSPDASTPTASRCRPRCSPSTCASRCPTAASSPTACTADNLPSLVDAVVVLLVRLHLADFYWGDVSLSNVLFRRDAGGFAAYLVDAETGELQLDPVDQHARARPHRR